MKQEQCQTKRLQSRWKYFPEIVTTNIAKFAKALL